MFVMMMGVFLGLTSVRVVRCRNAFRLELIVFCFFVYCLLEYDFGMYIEKCDINSFIW